MNRGIAVKQRESRFKLQDDPDMYVIGKHVCNLIAYFHPLNFAHRDGLDKFTSGTTTDILQTFNHLLYNRTQDEYYLRQRKTYPLAFRVTQLISYYGVEKIRDYLNLVYGDISYEEQVGP